MAYEIVFVNDGSRDRSAALLREQFAAPARRHAGRFCSTATSASTWRSWPASTHARGERVVTLDADLQNPPEEIGKLLAAMDAGHDYVGTIRRKRAGQRLPALRLARRSTACASASPRSA